MKFSKSILFIALLVAFNAWANHPASEANSTATAQSVTTSEAVKPAKKAQSLSLTDTSFFFGPGLNQPLKGQTADGAKEQIMGLWSRHFLALTYKIDPKLSLAPVLEFDYTFTDPTTGGAARGFRINDPFLKLARKDLVNTDLNGNKAILDGDIRYYAPASKSSVTNGTYGTVRVSLNPSVQFGRSIFSFSMENYAKYWIQPSATRDKAGVKRLKLYTGPQLNAKLSDSVTAFVLFEAGGHVFTNGAREWNDSNNSITDLEPGVNIQLHERVSLTPFLNWYLNQPLKTTSVNLVADLKLF